jgi:hypothetical protein
MGSIITYYYPDDWYAVREDQDQYYVCIGDIDDWYTDDPLYVWMEKDIFEKCLNKTYTTKRNRERRLEVLDENKNIVVVL